MIKRKMYDTLKNWNSTSENKVLILLGARQVGKTFIVREFAKDNFPSWLEVNFLSNKESADFLAGASSAQELISRLSLVAGRTLEAGTLLFFDEVQAAKDIVTLSKFLLEDGRFRIILSGSLLSTVLEGVTSFPVGYAIVKHMYPLDFQEFCWAMGVPNTVIQSVQQAYDTKTPLEESLHQRMVQLFRQYIVVGGMPEAVSQFVNGNRDLGAAREVAAQIMEQYRYDIAKYAPEKGMNIRTVFENIPLQLAKENKRFMMKSIREGATYQRLNGHFAWLVKAGVALPAHIVKEPKFPLARTTVPEKFKLYSSDCGLLLSQYPIAAAMGVIEGAKDVNYGSVYENVVAQELQSAGFALCYYNNNRKGEVDFLMETGLGQVIPIEVKSGKDYKIHTALNNLLKTEEYGIEHAYVMSEANVSERTIEGKTVYYLPLYMCMCFKSEKNEELLDITLPSVSFEDWTD